MGHKQRKSIIKAALRGLTVIGRKRLEKLERSNAAPLPAPFEQLWNERLVDRTIEFWQSRL